MAGSPTVLRAADLSARDLAQWDALCASRGRFADVYATGAWFGAWSSAATPADLAATRLATVVDGDRLRAVLPLHHRGGRGWGTAGSFRYRTSPAVEGELPDQEVTGLLVEQAARLAGRSLTLHRLPLRDPATGTLTAAMRDLGLRVTMRPVELDNVTTVEGGWAGHSRRFKGFARYAQRMVSRTEPLWEVAMETYGTSPACPVEAGFALYDDIQSRSWKGAFSTDVRGHRRDLLRRAEANGWARVFILRIGGVPVAGHVWFRVGGVATWLSTAYDERLASLSPGSVAQWWAHERMLDGTDGAVRVVDLLPGTNAQKERVAAEHPPLVDVVADRGVLAAVPRNAAAAAALARRRLTAVLPDRRRSQDEAAVRVRVVAVPPDPDASGSATPVDPEPVLLRFLAVAGGHANIEVMTSAWADGDTWLTVGAVPAALLRVGASGPAGRPVREVVTTDPHPTPADVVRSAAAATGETLLTFRADPDGTVDGPATLERRSPLPWPRCLLPSAVAGTGGAA